MDHFLHDTTAGPVIFWGWIVLGVMWGIGVVAQIAITRDPTTSVIGKFGDYTKKTDKERMEDGRRSLLLVFLGPLAVAVWPIIAAAAVPAIPIYGITRLVRHSLGKSFL